MTLVMTGMTLVFKVCRFILNPMQFQKFALGLAILLSTLICWGQNLQLDFASGLALSTNVEVVNKIPKSHLKRLPKELPVFRYSGKPRNFSTDGLQWLLEQSVFAGTNITELLPLTNSNSVKTGVCLKNEKNPPDAFWVNPLRGDVHVENVERKIITPKSDAVPSCDEIRERLLKLTKMLGIKTNEMEISNGIVQITCGDARTSAWSGHGMERVNIVSERWATIPRGVEGCSSWLFDDKITLDYGVDGRLIKFSMHWPEIEPVRTNRLLTVAEMIGKIKSNQALTDATDVTGNDVAQIMLKDIEIQYYYRQPAGFRGIAPNKTDIYPIAAILATFKSKSGQTENAGIYFPLLESQ